MGPYTNRLGLGSHNFTACAKRGASKVGLRRMLFNCVILSRNMSQAFLCAAIHAQNLVQFYYIGDDAPGPRLVEPHMVE